MHILLTGASGLLGLNFALLFSGKHQVTGVANDHMVDRAPFPLLISDLSQAGEASRLVDEVRPDVVLHCAALANVDRCEQEPELAEKINGRTPGELAEICRKRRIKMVHISTDAVFNGQRGNYVETDQPNPINAYARTKWVGEQTVAAADPTAIIARVNFYGWSLTGKRSLAEIFYYNLAAAKPMLGFTDVLFCPFQVGQLAAILLQMIEKDLQGLYHVVSPESLNKYDFGVRIARRFGLDENLISSGSWRDAGLTAVRSPNLTLNSAKLSRDLGISLPGQSEGIELFYQDFVNRVPERLRSMASASAG